MVESTNKKPLVSICTLTYNHAPYIEQTLDSFLGQEVDFDYEIIIHDDASKDGTQKILKRYKEKYPERIKLILQKENQYSQKINPMGTFVLPSANGKYLAICEGDDYWTDKEKLRKDIQYLEEHDDCQLLGSYVSLKHEKSGKLTNETAEAKRLTLADVIEKNYIHTCTMVLRAERIIPNIRLYSLRVLTNDRLIQFVSLMEGGYGYIRGDISGVYRIHEGGMFSPLNSLPRRMARLDLIDRAMPEMMPSIRSNSSYLLTLEKTYYLCIERNLMRGKIKIAWNLYRELKAKKLTLKPSYFFDRLVNKLAR